MRKYGVDLDNLAVDLSKGRERKREIVSSSRDCSEQKIVNAGVFLIYGKATFIENKIMEVILPENSRQLTADMIILNASGKPSIPVISRLDNVPYLDSTSMMELDQVPEHLIIVCGGYIVLESDQMGHLSDRRVGII